MADVENAEVKATVTVETKKQKKAAASNEGKKPKSKPTHPPTAQMVNSAIKELKERSGSSLPAIKKYLAANYKVDAEKLAPFIKKYLKNSVASGKLIQTKGKGASGSFKLASSKKTEKGESGGAIKKKSATKKSKEKIVKDKSEKKKSEKGEKKKKSEKKKSAITAAKGIKKTGSPKTKLPKVKKEKSKKEKMIKAAPKTPKTPKPKKLAAPKKTVVKKLVKK